VKVQVAGWPFRAHVVEDEALKDDAFVAGDVALACSGTVTTELALAGRPMVVGYKTSAVTYAIVKRLMKPRWITLFNIAAGKAVAPEFIQGDCEGEALARAVAERLDDPALRQRQVTEQYAALDRMGRGMPDPSEAAADALLDFLSARRSISA
jgi:lipid-A-disaccharide synthase